LENLLPFQRQVQMALGKAEARDLVEMERKNLSKYVQKQKSQLWKIGEKNSETKLELLSAVENLEASLSKEVPSSNKAYMKYKNQILTEIYTLEELLKEGNPIVSKEVQETFEGFKVKMDAFRVNLALRDKDNPEKVNQIKKDFTEKLERVRIILSENQNDQTKLGQFAEDISESYKYLKNAISDLTS